MPSDSARRCSMVLKLNNCPDWVKCDISKWRSCWYTAAWSPRPAMRQAPPIALPICLSVWHGCDHRSESTSSTGVLRVLGTHQCSPSPTGCCTMDSCNNKWLLWYVCLQFFHWQICKETVYVSIIDISTSSLLCRYTTSWNLKIQNNHQTFQPSLVTGEINRRCT